MIFVNNE
jgi:hypothetical protein